MLHGFSHQVVEIDANKFREDYPELTKYLVNKAKLTSKIYGATPTISLKSFYKTRTTPPLTSHSKSFSSSELDAVNSNNNKFLYFNGVTNKIEGVSLQSSFTTFKLNPYRNVNVITTTNQIFTDGILQNTQLPKLSNAMTTRKIDFSLAERIKYSTASLMPPIEFKSSQMVTLPLYHQIIYTIKFPNSIVFANEKNLIDLLNDQSVESSKMRVSLIRKVADQLGVNSSSLRLNWIEKFSKPSNNKTSESGEESGSQEDDLDNVLNMNYVNDKDYENDLKEPEFISDDLIDPKLNKAGSKMKGSTNVMISFSDTELLEMQKSYFNLLKTSSVLLNSHRSRLNDLRNRFYLDCEIFF